MGNRNVTLEELFKVSHYRANVQLDTPVIEQMKKSAGMAKKQKAPEPHFDVKAEAAPSSLFYTKAEARATVCFHLVWFMACRSDVRPEVANMLAEMLNSDVIPQLPRTKNAAEMVYTPALVKFLETGEGETYSGSSDSKLAPIGELTPIELFAFSRDVIAMAAVAALEIHTVISVMDIADAVAALSCEALQTPVSAFNEADYVCRPHRGVVESASNLRIFLKDSKNLKAEGKKAPKKRSLNAAELTPQQHGPARWSLPSIARSFKTELNGAPALGMRASFDGTAVEVALQSLSLYVAKLFKASQDRLGLLASAEAIPQAPSAGDANASKLISTLTAELRKSTTILETRRAEKEAINKAKEEKARLKAEEYKKKMEAANAAKGGNPVENEKAAAKRAAKAAKKAAKAAKKGGGKKNSSGLSLGAGTSWFMKLLAGGSDVGQYIDPSKDGLSTAGLLRELLDRIGSGGVMRVPKVVKGARDFEPQQMAVRQEAFEVIRGVFRNHGAVEIDTPVFELKETLTGKYGEDSKLIYELADQGGELLALRYDLTVPFARFLASHSVGNIKRFHIGKVYRRDTPNAAKGRFREFYQCDYDVAGEYDPMIPETEVLSVAIEILRALPIGDFAIKLNHRVLLDAMLDICGVPEQKFRPICSAIDKLDKEPWSAVRCEMIEVKGLDPVVADRIGRYVKEDSDVRTHASPLALHKKLMETEWTEFATHPRAAKAMGDLKLLFEYMEVMGVLDNISFDLSLARGLDYYTGLIYEAVITEKGERVGSIAAGGRYDNLVGMFSGKSTPCVGVSIGIERVFAIMERKAKLNNNFGAKPVDVLVASTGGSFIKERMKLCSSLWRVGLSAKFVYKVDIAFKRQLTMALEKDIPWMVILGENEIQKGVCQVKDMKARESKEVALDELPAYLAGKISGTSNTNAGQLGKLEEGVEKLSIGEGSLSSSNLELSKDGRFFRPKIS